MVRLRGLVGSVRPVVRLVPFVDLVQLAALVVVNLPILVQIVHLAALVAVAVLMELLHLAAILDLVHLAAAVVSVDPVAVVYGNLGNLVNLELVALFHLGLGLVLLVFHLVAVSLPGSQPIHPSL